MRRKKPLPAADLQTYFASVYFGDALENLRRLPSESVHTVVTSPPYFALRDYGTGRWEGGDPDCKHVKKVCHLNAGFNERCGNSSGEHKQEKARTIQYKHVCDSCGAKRIDQQMGSEDVPDCLGWATGNKCGECFICHMVELFAEVRRVLRNDGTCWINIGDSYAGGKPRDTGRPDLMFSNAQSRKPGTGMKKKDMCLIPQSLALALRADGWYVRCDVVWAKGNPMPSSVEDRPAPSHEYVWLLSKRPRYFYDHEAVKEPVSGNAHPRGTGITPKGEATEDENVKANSRFHAHMAAQPTTRNQRTVWNINSVPYKESYYATFPPELPRRCIMAGTSEHGVCSTCGAPYYRLTVKEQVGEQKGVSGHEHGDGVHGRFHPDGTTKKPPKGGVFTYRTIGWKVHCKCADQTPVPAIVLDPFLGSGTTIQVANDLGRRGVGIELNPEDEPRIRRRLRAVNIPLFAPGEK